MQAQAQAQRDEESLGSIGLKGDVLRWSSLHSNKALVSYGSKKHDMKAPLTRTDGKYSRIPPWRMLSLKWARSLVALRAAEQETRLSEGMDDPHVDPKQTHPGVNRVNGQGWSQPSNSDCRTKAASMLESRGKRIKTGGPRAEGRETGDRG